MKRHLFVLATLLMISTLILTGCQQQGQAIPSDPVEAVKVIADKQQEIKSQHLDLNAELTLKLSGLPSDDPTAALLRNFEASLTAAGDVDNTNENVQISGTADLGILTAFLAQGADELTFDLVKVGDTVYVRALDQEWNESTVSSESATNADVADLAALSGLLKKVAKAERLGDEAIDGTDSYHFKVTLDPIELINELSKLSADAAEVTPEQLAQAQDLLKDSEIDLEMWIGKADLFIRQQKIHLKLDLKNIPDAPPEATVLVDVNITTKNSKINEPVSISAPK